MRGDPLAMTSTDVGQRAGRSTAGTTRFPTGATLLAERLRVLVVAGIPVGVLVAGAGSRLAMFVLRATSPEYVHGVTSDDGFTIGKVTLGGTYNLLLLGSSVGVIGAVVYGLVAPRLVGPVWFRRLTTALASAAVVGSMLVHADGIDFKLLEPTWLAIGLFVALPAVFGVLIGAAVDAAGRPDSWTAHHRRRWILPIVALGCFPPTLVTVAVAVVPVGLGIVLQRSALVQRLRALPVYTLAIRAAWLLIGVAGLVALLGDIDALT
jgi:hypothetical protein